MVLTSEIRIHDLSFVPYINQEQILERIYEMASEINKDFEGKTPLFVPILNGAFMFASDLLKQICIPCEVSFVKVASYQGENSLGEVEEIIGLKSNIKGRHIILVEDIVDTGLTMSQIVRTFLTYEPASLSVATLFVKPESVQVELPLTYKGFEIENKFIVGYGLDYNQQGRNLRDIYIKVD